MADLLIPVQRREMASYNRDVPLAMRGQVSAICRSMQECEELVKFFGDDSLRPTLPILLIVPGLFEHGKKQVILVAGLGYATVAELKDLCVTTWGRAELRVQERGSQFRSFDELREKYGLMPAASVDAAVREAMMDRIQRYKRNTRTDPARKGKYG